MFKSSEPNAGHVTCKIGPLYFNKTLELSDLVTHFTTSRGPCNNFKVIECISCKERIEIIGMSYLLSHTLTHQASTDDFHSTKEKVMAINCIIKPFI